MKTIIVHGNCNCDYYANRLKESLDKNIFSVHHFVNHTNEHIPEEMMRRCDYYIYQFLEEEKWKEYSSRHVLARLPQKAKQLRVPIFSFLPFWPGHSPRPDSYPKTHEYPYGLYIYGDTVLDDMACSDSDAKSIADRYLERDLTRIFDFDTLMEENYIYYTSKDNAGDINVYHLIMAHLQDDFLFHTCNHPSEFLMEHILDVIFDFLDITPVQIENKFDSMFDFLQIPIHPSLIDYFKLPLSKKSQSYNIYWQKVNARTYYTGYLLDLPVHDHKKINMQNFRQYNPRLNCK